MTSPNMRKSDDVVYKRHKVWKGVLDESSAGGVPGYTVAVKTSKEGKGEGAEEMMREATVMAQVSGHPNLVSLIGVVTSGTPLLLAISLCEHGSLLSVLKDRKRKGRTAKPFTFAERAKMALDTAKGMAHLTECKFVHRDLAARNVLVDALHTCKVADFGLARGTAGARAGPETNDDGDEEEYYRSRTGTFPVRWTAPEAMQTMRFTEATDVWSFGILVVEIYTDGGKPYAGMTNAAVISKVQAGYRAPQPTGCTDDMYTIMLECWCEKGTSRPAFHNLVNMLQGVLVNAGQSGVENNDAVETEYTRGQEDIGAKNGSHGIAFNGTYMETQPDPTNNGTGMPSQDSTQTFVVGDRVIVTGVNSEGTVRFVGPHKVKGTERVGVELDKQVGKNNGTIGGNIYFHAKERHGALCLPSDCTLISNAGSIAETVLDDAPNFASLRRHTSSAGSKQGWMAAKAVATPARDKSSITSANNAAYISAAPSVALGDRVTVDGYKGEGTVRFVGPHKVKGTMRIGVELDQQVGKNNGTIGGKVYFTAKDRHGVLCSPNDCTIIGSTSRGVVADDDGGRLVLAETAFDDLNIIGSTETDDVVTPNDEYLSVVATLQGNGGDDGAMEL